MKKVTVTAYPGCQACRPMLLDVSMPVNPRTAEFPGDEPFSCGWTLRKGERGSAVNAGWVKTSPHVGTHVDAPYHYDDRGHRVGGFALDAFVGACVVVDAIGRSALDADLFRGLDLARTPRVLFRVRRRNDPEIFHDEYPLLTRGAIEALATAGVRLVGIDAPSYDEGASDLPIHRALGRAGIANVENLVLDDVAAGTYELLAQPVKWVDMDAAPLRAILRK